MNYMSGVKWESIHIGIIKCGSTFTVKRLCFLLEKTQKWVIDCLDLRVGTQDVWQMLASIARNGRFKAIAVGCRMDTASETVIRTLWNSTDNEWKASNGAVYARKYEGEAGLQAVLDIRSGLLVKRQSLTEVEQHKSKCTLL